MSMQDALASIAASKMPLQGKLDALKAELADTGPPPAIADLIHRATNELIANGIASMSLRARDAAPSFLLPDSEGRLISSRELLLRGPLIVTFYRGVWCHYCNFDLQALEAARPGFESRGATLAAVSPQTVTNSRRSHLQNGTNFPILCDRAGKVSAKFFVRWTVPDYLREVHKQVGADLSPVNGEDSWTLPMPARYVSTKMASSLTPK